MEKRCVMRFLFALFTSLLVFNLSAAGETELSPAMENPGTEEKPDWFKVSFLDLHEDIEEAAESNKRVMLFFFKTGVPTARNCLKIISGNARFQKKLRNILM